MGYLFPFIKELIQNAEDAEATEINILYDARQINHTSATNENYNKFFKVSCVFMFCCCLKILTCSFCTHYLVNKCGSFS
jgi:hypothetical protein